MTTPSPSAPADTAQDSPVTVNETEVPLAETPDGEELTTIDEGEVPLAETPGEELVDIPEEEVPLAEIPKTGDVSPLWNAGAALSAGGLAALSRKKKEKR